MNTLIEMPVENQNRIKSKAYIAWAESTQDKKAFIEMYERLSAEKYFAVQRLEAEIAQMKERIIKLQTPTK